MDWAGFAQQMAAMARDLLAQESVDATLNRITGSATELVEGCEAAGILVLRGKEVQTLAPTHELVTDSDRLQERLSEGPCFDAARVKEGERVFRIPDFTREQPRWPAFAPQAHQLGVGSMMGFLLYTEDEELGALNVYSGKPGAFTEVSELVGWLLGLPRRRRLLQRPYASPAGTRGRHPAHDRRGHGHPHGQPPPHRRTGVRHAAPIFAGAQHQTPRGRPPDLRTRQRVMTTRAAPPARGLNQRSLAGPAPRGNAARPGTYRQVPSPTGFTQTGPGSPGSQAPSHRV